MTTHKAMVTDAAVERMARWLAKNEGLDPDLKGSHFHEDPVWMEFADDAREALALAQAETQPVAWIYEDELPNGYPYDAMFPYSKVDGVRMFPVYAPGASPVPAKREAVVVKALEDAAEAGWNACRLQVYLLSEDYIERTHPIKNGESVEGNFYRGQYDVAKSFAKAFNSFEARDCHYFKQIDFAALTTSSTPADGDVSHAPVSNLMGKAEAFDRIVEARKAYVDAVADYNSRLEVVRAERDRGNWSMKVDDEFVRMTNRQQEWFRTVQDLADAAIAGTPAPQPRKGRLHEWSGGGVCRDCGCLFAGLSRVDPCPGSSTAPSKEGSSDE